MNTKLVTFFVLFTILFGCALCTTYAAESSAIQLHVYGVSTRTWLAVDPQNERYDTAAVEVREAGSLNWAHAIYNDISGYFQVSSENARGFRMPLSFRFTAKNGERAVTGAFMNKIVAGAVEDTGIQYDVVVEAPTQAPTAASTAAPIEPTTAPTEAPVPTEAPTESPTEAPTSLPTEAPTEDSEDPTEAPTAAPVTPTKASTQAPQGTQVPTQAPTLAPTKAPTQAATLAPTKAPTQAPTQVPTLAPTKAPTQAPTLAPTKAPTLAPTIPPVVDLCAVTSPRSEPVQIMVPLYVYPGAAWDQLVDVAKTGVKIIAVINPNSGPNPNGPDSAYVTYTRKLVEAGIDVVGYVHTSWGDRDINTVTSEIEIYATKYAGVKGIFFDEGATEASKIPYYRQAYNYLVSKNFVHSILNPGVQPDQGYLAISTNIVIFENYASALATTTFSSWVTCAANAAAKVNQKFKYTAIVHTASLADMPSLIAKSHALGMGVVYITDGLGGCCTYNTLTSYFPQQGSAVKAFNS